MIYSGNYSGHEAERRAGVYDTHDENLYRTDIVPQICIAVIADDSEQAEKKLSEQYGNEAAECIWDWQHLKPNVYVFFIEGRHVGNTEGQTEEQVRDSLQDNYPNIDRNAWEIEE